MAGSGLRGKSCRKSGIGEPIRNSSLVEGDVRADAPRPRIEPGEYDAICYKVEIGNAWRRSCYVLFRICGGKHDGVELFMACSYPQGILSTRTKLHTQWTLAIGRNPRKGERFSRKVFLHKMYTILVRDTKRKFPDTNKLLPGYCQYSVVKTIIEVQTGVSNDF